VSTVAIIIPAFNAASWLAEAIDSALAQTLPASSVVVVDDGSTDATAAVAEKYADAVVLIRQPNAGVSAARNHGAAQVNTDWLLFLDADDRLRPEALETLAQRAAGANMSAIYGQTVDFTRPDAFEDPRGNSSMQGTPPAGAQAAFWKAPIATPGAVMLRREVFESAGGWNERFNTTADRDLWCRIGVLAEFGFAHHVIVERRMHGENMSADKNRARRQAVEVQLHFLQWCAARGVDTGFLETSDTKILERNVLRAIDERAFVAAQWIADEAARRGLSGAAFNRARRLANMPRFAREMELKVRGFLGL
jgi:glycosyltransferase involved in cell wall biosynthesis